MGTINCVMAAAACGVSRVVVSASSSCYGDPVRLPTPEDEPIDPLSPYALQKYSAERHALLLGERHGVEVVALRYFNVYGPRSFSERNPFNAYSSVVGIFARSRARGEELLITGDGSQERDFIWVEDVARANLAAARGARASAVYNVGSGETISILALAELFEHPFRFLPPRGGEARVTWADVSRIRADLGWAPDVALAEGIEKLDAYARSS
jgi:UDP-glucose 4-epimerase